jgi:hypothetical protein
MLGLLLIPQHSHGPRNRPWTLLLMLEVAVFSGAAPIRLYQC